MSAGGAGMFHHVLIAAASLRRTTSSGVLSIRLSQQSPYPGPPSRRQRVHKWISTWGPKAWSVLFAVALALGALGGFLAWAWPRGDGDGATGLRASTQNQSDLPRVLVTAKEDLYSGLARALGPAYVLPFAPSHLPKLPSGLPEAGWGDWALSQGGVRAGSQQVDVVVEADAARTVTLTGLGVRIIAIARGRRQGRSSTRGPLATVLTCGS